MRYSFRSFSFDLERLGEARLLDDAADLGRDRAEEPHLVGAEAPAAKGLHDQHTERTAPRHHRHAEERVVPLLTRLRKILVPRVGHRIDDHHRLELLEDEAGEALVDAHFDLADRLAVEALGGPEGQAPLARIVDVERADFRLHPLGDDLHDPLERALQVVRVRDDGADVVEQRKAGAATDASRGTRRLSARFSRDFLPFRTFRHGRGIIAEAASPSQRADQVGRP